MHEKTKVYRVKKGERCLKPLAHHTFITPGAQSSEAEEDCLVIIPHCSENHGVIISDEYLKELGYYYIHSSAVHDKK